MSRLFVPLCAVLIAALTIPVLAQDEPERKPAQVMTFHGADWLERPGRLEEERPFDVIATMGLKDGDIVGDIGCGSGYFSRKFAKAVAPSGKVFAVDIQPEFIEMVKENCAAEDITNVVPVLGEEDDPLLEPNSIDWLFLADVYHEFQQPEPMLAKMLEALKPGGHVALLEYRLLGDTATHIKVDHRMSVEQVMREWVPAGFTLVARHEFLPHQHFFVFKKVGKEE